MISLEEMRKIEPKLIEKSDEELIKIRDLLYGLAKLSLESYFDVSKNLRGVSGLKNDNMPK